jgi:hypothetical protein
MVWERGRKKKYNDKIVQEFFLLKFVTVSDTELLILIRDY